MMTFLLRLGLISVIAISVTTYWTLPVGMKSFVLGGTMSSDTQTLASTLSQQVLFHTGDRRVRYGDERVILVTGCFTVKEIVLSLKPLVEKKN